MFLVEFNFKIKLSKLIQNQIIVFYHYILNSLSIPRFNIFINIVDNNFIKLLNFKWLKKKYATDILTFSSMKISCIKNWNYIFGDIIISIEKIIFHSHLLGINVYEELTIIIIHSIMHLLGFDHNKSYYKNMLQKILETKILKKFKIVEKKILYNRICIIYIKG
jgi:probable rRNA maturation factor